MPSSSDHVMPDRPHATAIGAFLEGWRRTLRAPAVVLAVWIVTTAVTLPLAATLQQDLTAHFGSSTAAEQALDGWDPDWTGEFAGGASGVAGTFTREVLGAAGTIAAVSRLLSGEPLAAPLMAGVAVYLLCWVFLSGAIVDRIARARPIGGTTFVALGARYFPRLLRLAIVAGVVYWLAFRLVHPLLFGTVLDSLTRNTTSEPRGLAVIGGLYVLFALLLGGISLIVDFTRIRLVVEDRRSVVVAIAAAFRFVRRRFWRCAGLYALNLVALLVIVRLWVQVAVGADGADWLALLVSQVYVVGRIWARVAFLGSEAVFYQGELAHARYTAAPLPRWPDSVSVEAIRNLRNG